MSATVIPDVGELIIQNSLAEIFGERFAAYDVRTSDPGVASDISVTWLYDLFHSVIFPSMLGLIGWKV